MITKSPCGACDACEHCPYPDCTWDGVTRAEWDAAKAEDAAARHFVESKVAAQQRAYYESHKEQIMEAQRHRRAKKKGMDMDFSCIDNMPVEVMDKAMKSFLTEYIWATVMKDLECRVEQYMSDVTSACEREKELKDTIEAVVDIEYDNHGSLIQDDVNEAVLALTERCLSVLEGIV